MFDQLRAFLAIAERGTFRSAAQALHLSQPAVSAAVLRLEEALGARLFDRGSGRRARRTDAGLTGDAPPGAQPRDAGGAPPGAQPRDAGGTALTAAGRALVPHARAALAAVDGGRRAVREVEGLEAGEARIGGGATACTYVLPDVIVRFRAAHPRVRLVLREAPTDLLFGQLAAGELDLVIGAPPWRDPAPFQLEPFWNDQLVLVGAAGGGRVVGDRPLVSLPRGSTRALLEGLFPRGEVAVELGSLAAVKAAARAGVGVALVSHEAARRDLASRRLVRLRHPGTPLHRTWYLVHRGEARLAPATAELRRLLLERRPPRFRRPGAPP